MRAFDTGDFHNADTFEAMATIPDASVDMILADLPYGTTRNRWDAIIPFEPLWQEYWRIAKPNAPIILTASQPFTTTLIASQLQHFRYSLVWQKPPTGALNAKRRPMQAHEDILIFYRSAPVYNPQGLRPTVRHRGESYVSKSENYGRTGAKAYTQTVTGYPRSILAFGHDPRKLHPTQKPVPLFEYLIRTYTNPGDTVLDNVAGSGTTAITAINAGRRWISVERDPDYFAKACERIEKHNPAQTVTADKYS